ncbi:MAG: DsbA family protein [Bacteroidia bacterium]|nr:DsbA family protein [Bacteroidia bacterium]
MEEVEDRPQLLYVFDPLCGWCYGFHEVMERIETSYGKQFEFQVLTGGMVRGDRVGPIGKVAAYIKEAYKTVEQRTGVTFGEGFLTNILAPGTAVFDSDPPSKAFVAIKHHAPDRQVAIASAIQKVIYQDGMEPAKPASYQAVAQEFGLDPNELLRIMQAESTMEAIEMEYNMSAQLGVSGFPTVFLFTQTHRFLLARGYVSYEELDESIGQAFAYMQS